MRSWRLLNCWQKCCLFVARTQKSFLSSRGVGVVVNLYSRQNSYWQWVVFTQTRHYDIKVICLLSVYFDLHLKNTDIFGTRNIMERQQHHHFVFDFLLGVIVSNEGQVLRAASDGEKVDQYISIFSFNAFFGHRNSTSTKNDFSAWIE